MKVLEVAAENAAEGGWKLRQFHLSKLGNAHPQSVDISAKLDTGSTPLTALDPESVQCAIRDMSEDKMFEDLLYQHRLEWRIPDGVLQYVGSLSSSRLMEFSDEIIFYIELHHDEKGQAPKDGKQTF